MADIAVVVPISPEPTSPEVGRLWMLSTLFKWYGNSRINRVANIGTKDAFVLPVGTDKWATSAE